jgi:hypothetical protein
MREGKRPLERPRHIRADNIMMVLGEVGWGGWTGFVWGVVVKSS